MGSKESFVRKEGGRKANFPEKEDIKKESKGKLKGLSEEPFKKPSLEELKKEKVMSKKEAEREVDMMMSVESKEKRPNVGFDGSVLAERMYFEHCLEEDRKAGRISNLFKFFFVNSEKKMFATGGDGKESPYYKADMVFYCELGDGKVKRMYLSANEFVPLYEDVSFSEGYTGSMMKVHVLGVEEARGICGFKESSPKSQ